MYLRWRSVVFSISKLKKFPWRVITLTLQIAMSIQCKPFYIFLRSELWSDYLYEVYSSPSVFISTLILLLKFPKSFGYDRGGLCFSRPIFFYQTAVDCRFINELFVLDSIGLIKISESMSDTPSLLLQDPLHLLMSLWLLSDSRLGHPSTK